jgi:hypothetical protein
LHRVAKGLAGRGGSPFTFFYLFFSRLLLPGVVFGAELEESLLDCCAPYNIALA